MPLGAPWPDTADAREGPLVVGGCDARALAERFGTPLYVYDAATLRSRAWAYREPVDAHPAGGLVAFACKANPAVALLRLLGEEGLGADVSSSGELAAALRAGIPAERIVVHGNAKTDVELDAAVGARCGLLVVDNLDEPARVAAAAERHRRRQRVAVRVTPGIRAGGHAHIETGGEGSKFGLGPQDAAACVRACLDQPALEWVGLHVHLGSQISDAAPLERIDEWLLAFCAEHGLEPQVIDLGGGLGIAYEPGEPQPDPRRLATALSEAVTRTFPKARLVLEPGRSVVGTAGITLYRVVTTKTAADGTRFAAVDGGMSDNLRPSLYGARYAALAADRAGEPADLAIDVAGKHCESGDVLIRGAQLPDVRPGELLAVAATGAYGQSMANTYNGTPRAAAVLVEDGVATLITRRETVQELLSRDVDPPVRAGRNGVRPPAGRG
jgi:diaminopimelate decarboxylase